MGFDTVLIANRGEIAVRVIRSARALGYRTVAVYSDADAEAPHVALADVAVRLGPAPAAESYLSIPRLIEAARRSGAQAVHPGYGFLSENAQFAEACGQAGLTFIGPPAEAIRLMGNKRQAKRRMREAGVPVVPGYDGAAQEDAALCAEAERIGTPLMVKAAAGGGGRGMRLVEALSALPAALQAARSEARNAFGSDELILERALPNARHVEIQVFADAHGAVLHLGERDCSVQRRHQKVIEEAPSPAVDPELRRRMGEAAVAAARAIGYVGAGTVEFLLAADGGFHFLEMNTRLQVEHPVTEMLTGLDLVAWQLRVAAGEALPLRQEEVRLAGHAIEARLYAEDPAASFLPQTGTVLRWRPPALPGVRIDSGIGEGLEVGAHYDPLLAKVIAHGRNREEARRKLLLALRRMVLLGLPSNRAFLIAALRHPAFAAGEVDTGFIERHLPDEQRRSAPASDAAWALAAVLRFRCERAGAASQAWRSTGEPLAYLRLRHGEEERALRLRLVGGDRYGVAAQAGGTDLELNLRLHGENEGRCLINDVSRPVAWVLDGQRLWLDIDGDSRLFEAVSPLSAGEAEAAGGLAAPMSGRILVVHAGPGDRVRKGQVLFVLEAMKIEHEIRAGADGIVETVAVAAGEQVDARQALALLRADESE